MRKQLSARQVFERSISEEDVFGACRALLELNGARVHRVVERIPWGRKKSEPGLPDSFGWWPRGAQVHPITGGDSVLWLGPRHFFIEFKKPGGAHRPAQERWIAEARQDGVIAFFASSVEEMADEFKKFGISLKGL